MFKILPREQTRNLLKSSGKEYLSNYNNRVEEQMWTKAKGIL
jgi:hypothetical protein